MILTFLFCSFVFRLNSDAQKHKGWKRYGIIFCLLGGIISSAIFYGRTESYYIAKDRSKEFPMTHWIMMASHDIGSFDQNDVNYTMQFAGREQKKEANIKRIKENYSDLGVKTHSNFVLLFVSIHNISFHIHCVCRPTKKKK